MGLEDWDAPLSPEEAIGKNNPYIDSPECGLDLFSRLLPHRKTGNSLNPAFLLRKRVTNLFLLLKHVRMRDSLTHYRRFLSLCDKATALEKCRLLTGKTVVGFGGQFSSGKSSFINAISGLGDILPAEQDPTTSIPTFVVASEQERRTAHTVHGGIVELDVDAVEALSHAFHKKYQIGFSPFLDSIIVETPKFALNRRIALLDTPGYTKPEDETAVIGIISDRRRAQEQLQAADYLIWVADITEGSIHPEDMDFIDDLRLDTPFLWVYNKADLKTASERQDILQQTRRDVKKMTTKCYGVAAYSSTDKKEYTGHLITDFLKFIALGKVQSNDLEKMFSQTEESLRISLNEVLAELENETDRIWGLLQRSYDPDRIGSLASLWSQHNRSCIHLKKTLTSFKDAIYEQNRELGLLLKGGGDSVEKQANKTVPSLAADQKNKRAATENPLRRTITAKKLMPLLAKVMKVANAEHTELQDGFRSLSDLVQKDLRNALNASLFPQAPEADKRLSDMLERLDAMCICKELHSHPVMLFAGAATNSLFFHLKGILFHGSLPKELFSNYTILPFLVVHGDKPSLQAINYSNARIDLDIKREYPALIQGCRNNNICLHRIIKLFVVTLPMQRPDERYLFDNDKGVLLRLFRPIVLRKTYVLDTKYPRIPKRYYDDIIAPEGCAAKGKSVTIEAFAEKVFPLKRIPVYGFRDEYASIENWISGYFSDYVSATKEMTQQLRDDVFRQDNGNQELVDLRDQMAAREAGLNDVWQTLRPKLRDVRDAVSHIESLLEVDAEHKARFSSRVVLDWVFSSLFDTQEWCCDSYAVRKSSLERLAELRYHDMDLVGRYIAVINGNECSLPSEYQNCLPSPAEWEKAKMLLELCDPEQTDPEILKKWFSVLNLRCVSGKTLYIKALITESPSDRERALRNAFERGYVDAAKLLLDSADIRSLNYLARGLYPHACLLLGNRIVEEGKEKHKDQFFPTITAYCMIYYKLAASQGDLYGVKAIVDLLYEYTFPFPRLLDSGYVNSRLIQNALVICWLAQKLVEGGIESEHYQEILGVTLFCLGERPELEGNGYVRAWKVLCSLREETWISKYCKAYMLAHGKGVVQDLKGALAQFLLIKKGDCGESGAARQYVWMIDNEISCILEQLAEEKEKQKDKYQKGKKYTIREKPVYTPPQSSGSTTMVFLVSLGLAYQSDQLDAMRRFRDMKFGSTETGRQLIHEYYRIGPILNDAIAHSEDPKSEYDRLWENYGRKAYEALQHGDTETCQERIIAMQLDLCEKYNVMYDKQLLANYLSLQQMANLMAKS